MSRQAGSLNSNQRLLIGAHLLAEQAAMVSSMALVLSEMKCFGDGHPDAIEVTNTESYNFFCKKVDFLAHNGELSFLLGIPMTVFHELLQISPTGTYKCSPTIRMTIFIKYLKEGVRQTGMNREVGLSQPTISRIISSVSRDLVRVASSYIKFPSTIQELRSLQSASFSKVNRQGYLHAQMFRSGPLPEMLHRLSVIGGCQLIPGSNTPLLPILLADRGFGLSEHVITPYHGTNLTQENMLFNRIHSNSRVVIENLFGIIRSRFGIFDTALNLDPENSRALIVSAAVIQNIIRGPMPSSSGLFESSPVVPNPYNSAKEQREALKAYVLN
ncbi:unnamed protein product [Caenorhabditis brenneri]